MELLIDSPTMNNKVGHLDTAFLDNRVILIRNVLLQPVGVVGAITPWNFPLAMITRKVGLVFYSSSVVSINDLVPCDIKLHSYHLKQIVCLGARLPLPLQLDALSL